MRLYQMRDKIIYGTVRQYHIWFILLVSYFPFLSYFFLFYVIMFKIFSKKWNDYTGEEMIWK